METVGSWVDTVSLNDVNINPWLCVTVYTHVFTYKYMCVWNFLHKISFTNFLLFKKDLFFHLGETERAGREEEQREIETWADSTPSNAGLNPMTLRSWLEPKPKVGHSINWATQVPPNFLDVENTLLYHKVDILNPGLKTKTKTKRNIKCKSLWYLCKYLKFFLAREFPTFGSLSKGSVTQNELRTTTWRIPKN